MADRDVADGDVADGDVADGHVADGDVADDTATEDVATGPDADARAPADLRRGDHGPHPAEALRGLAGGGPSKIGVNGAMRARDVSRPHSPHGRPA